jgi:hypothetical protein
LVPGYPSGFVNGVDTTDVPVPLSLSTTLSCPLVPKIGLTKMAGVMSTSPYQPVTYTYIITNTGNETLSNVTLTDDNGANNPTLFQGQGALPTSYTYHGADIVIGTVPSLAPGGFVTFTEQLYPAITLCGTIKNVLTPAGTLIFQHLSASDAHFPGDFKITYLQSFALNDNTYGTNSSSGWGHNGHKFQDLVGSDQAEFRVTNDSGKIVFDGEIDYIDKATSKTFPGGMTVSYPSGWGSLGDTGGDGKVIDTADNSKLLFATTTLTTDLNQSPAYYGFTTNSPAASDANWDPIDGYTVVLSGSLFGMGTLGSVTIPEVHNSPSKTAEIKNPVYCPNPSTNTATVTATTPDGKTITATATSTVTLK